MPSSGVAGAWLDSMPCLFISLARCKSADLKLQSGPLHGSLARSEVDIVTIVESDHQIRGDDHSIPQERCVFIMEKALYLAKKRAGPGRYGSMFPWIMQAAQVDVGKPAGFCAGGGSARAGTATLKECRPARSAGDAARGRTRPVIVAGNGIRDGGCDPGVSPRRGLKRSAFRC